jgi:hypothetical protein
MDYTQRPSLLFAQLADITNTLARWLPGAVADTAVTSWDVAQWEAAEWIVYWQNALPWLVQRLRESGVDVPEPVRGRLWQLDADSRERTRRMLDACVELLAALAEVGVTAMPFKGAALAALYYDDPLVRPLADLDILIQKADLKRSLAVLQQLGYYFYSRSAEDEVYLRGERKTNIWAPDNVHPVELHYTLREEYAGVGYDLAGMMWANSARRPYWQGSSAVIANTPTLLHHVCAHATSDLLIQRARLLHLDDIGRLVAQMDEGDWQVFATAVSPKAARFVYPSLDFASRYAQVVIPETVEQQLREHCPSALLRWLAQVELADVSEANPAVRSGIGFDLARRLALSRADEARFWLRSCFPRRWNLSKRYPRLVETPFWPLGYLLINVDRAWHLLKRGA